jgi:hypothetical protein
MPKPPVPHSSSEDISQFLAKVRGRAEHQGRLIFALDATASREATWGRACSLHAEMFDVAAAFGGLAIQLAYYRGFREFYCSSWSNSPGSLLKEMSAVRCAGGRSQIGRVLKHAVKEQRERRVGALIFIGDAFEEDIDACCDTAGQLALLNLPVFVFQEGNDAAAERAMRQIAKLSKGAYCRLDGNSAELLKELLRAIAAYVAGGLPEAKRLSSRHKQTQQLLNQL